MASLGIVIKREQVDEGKESLLKFTKAAGEAETATTKLGATSKRVGASVAADMARLTQTIRTHSASVNALALNWDTTARAGAGVTAAMERMRQATAQSGADAMAAQLAKLDPFQEKVAVSAIKVASGFNNVARSAASLAVQTIGLNSGIGRLGSSLLMLGGGGGTLLLVAGAAAVLGFAYNKLSEDTKEARIEQERLYAVQIKSQNLLAAKGAGFSNQLSVIMGGADPFSAGGRLNTAFQGAGGSSPFRIGGDYEKLVAKQKEDAAQKAADVAAMNKDYHDWLNALSQADQLWGSIADDIARANANFQSTFTSTRRLTGPEMFDQALAAQWQVPTAGAPSNDLSAAIAAGNAWRAPKVGRVGRGISGQDAGLAGIAALQGLMSGGGAGSVLGGGLSLAGSAFGPIGSALGGLLGSGLGKLFGGGGPSKEYLELQRIRAELEESKKVQQRLVALAEEERRLAKVIEVIVVSSTDGREISRTRQLIKDKEARDDIQRYPGGA